MKIEFNEPDLKAILQHGESTYPHECCGFLMGRAEPGKKHVEMVIPASNARGGEDRHNRYLITPEDFLHAEKEARSRKLDIIGFYHSHPDVEGRPSAYDTEHAWPWYSYVIVSVKKKKADHVRSWVLKDDRSHFDEEQIIVWSSKEKGTCR